MSCAGNAALKFRFAATLLGFITSACTDRILFSPVQTIGSDKFTENGNVLGALTVNLYVLLVPVQFRLSVTFTVIENDPVSVGVPDKAPFDAKVNPRGNVPEFSIYVAVPTAPVCVND